MALVKRGKSYGVVVYDRGKRQWIGTYRTKDEAKDAEARAHLNRRDLGSQTLVKDFAETWLTNHPRPKRSTEVHYEQMIGAFVRDFGSKRFRDLDRVTLRAWALKHRAAFPTARALLGDAQRDELIANNPLTGLRIPTASGRKHVDPPSEADVARLVELAAKVHARYGEVMYGPMIRVAAYTGLRPGELHALRWSDVDRETIRIERQYNAKTSQFTAPKNGRPRTIFIVDQVREALERIPRTTSDGIFQTKNGKPFTGRVSHYYWDPVRAAFGRPDLDFYLLRHHCGTWLAHKNVPAPAIAEMLGHTDGGKLALSLYIHYGEQQSHSVIKSLVTARPDLTVVSNRESA